MTEDGLRYAACVFFTILGFLFFIMFAILALFSLAPAIAFLYFCLCEMFNKEAQTTFDPPTPTQPEIFTLTPSTNIFADPSSIGIVPATPLSAAASPFIFIPGEIEAEIRAVENSSDPEWTGFSARSNWQTQKQKSRFRWAWDGFYGMIKRRTAPKKAFWWLFGGTAFVWAGTIALGWVTVGYALPRMDKLAQKRAGNENQ